MKHFRVGQKKQQQTNKNFTLGVLERNYRYFTTLNSQYCFIDFYTIEIGMPIFCQIHFIFLEDDNDSKSRQLIYVTKNAHNVSFYSTNFPSRLRNILTKI